MDRVRARVGDKRVLALVKAFLKAGILSEDGTLRDNDAGTPQGGILSPLLSQRGPVGPGRAHRPGAGRADSTSNERRKRRRRRSAELPAGPVRGRLVPDWSPAPRPTPRPCGTEIGGGLVHDGPAPVAGEDADHPYRRGPRLPRVAHPAPPQARHRPSTTSTPTRPRRPLQAVMAKVKTLCRDRTRTSRSTVLLHRLNSDAAGLVRLLPARGVQRDLRLPEPLHVAHGVRMAAAQTPRIDVEGTPPPLLRRRLVASQRRAGSCSTRAKVGTTRYRYRGTTIPTPWPTPRDEDNHTRA